MMDPYGTPRVPLCSQQRGDQEAPAWDGIKVIADILPAHRRSFHNCKRCARLVDCAANVRRHGAAMCETLFVELAGAVEVLL